MTRVLLFATLIYISFVSVAQKKSLEGLSFFNYSGNELLAKAKKPQKQVFVDMYSGWYSLFKQMELQHSQQPFPERGDGGLFVHTDKDFYVNNETIWFSAYLFAGKKDELGKHSVLSIMLSSAETGKALITEKYPVNDGLSNGKFILPDSIKPGVFKLIAYTDVLDQLLKPIALFTANIYIGNQPSSELKRNDAESAGLRDSAFFNVTKPQILTDKRVYEKRERVKLVVKFRDSSGRPVQGLFSVSVAHESRMNTTNQKITQVPPQSLDNITVHIPRPLTLNVRYKGRPIDKSKDVIVFGSSGLQVFSTDEKGMLQIDRDKLLSNYGKKIAMMVSGNNNGNYQINFTDTLSNTGIVLAKERILTAETLDRLQKENSMVLVKLADRVIELNTVTIKGRSGVSGSYKGVPGINDCGDWVDEYDYLNYPYSQKRYQPIMGKQYRKRTDLSGQNNPFKVEPVYYTGCESSTKSNKTLAKGINLGGLFYGLDKSSTQLQHLTTLFWGAELLSDVDGNAEISFSAADLSGDYRIVLQGITGGGVCYGEAVFEVK